MMLLSGIIVLGILISFWLYTLSITERTDKTLRNDTTENFIDSILPQTQCGQCGYSGCRPYAEAIANGIADINQCPPGGDKTILQLATLLGTEPKPLNPDYGITQPRTLAVIDEEVCIGCVKCIHACPVDAIIGAPKALHTVIKSECTGCELCIEPCPVDCISMQPLFLKANEWVWNKPKPVERTSL